jgi:parallel beta-helix repeat protein
MEKIMMNKKITRLIIIAILLFCTVSASADVIFVAVDNDANDLDGSSWELAFTDLQDALAAAVNGDDIWVAAGTYVPGTATVDRFNMQIEGDTNGSFDLYGSFAGIEVPATFDLADRDFDANPTILSGQNITDLVIYSRDARTIDPVVDGFIISGAKYGVWMTTTDLVLKSCIFTENVNNGIMVRSGASPVIEDCIIESSALSGIYFQSTTSPVVKNCIVRFNGKKGLECIGGDTTIVNCWIHHNTEQGIYFYGSDANDEIRNNTIVYNNIGNAGYGGFYNNDNLYTNISNCIFWGNEPDDQIYHGSPVYSCVMNGTAEAGNIIDDPMFDDAADPNNDFHLLPDSPCIDTGNPDPNLYVDGEVDLDGDQRVLNYIIDMGADEDIPMIKTADFDDSGRVTSLDFATFGQAWLSSQGDDNFNQACDLDGTGQIDIDDLMLFADQWLSSIYDFDNNGAVNYPDFAILKQAWLSSEGDPEFNEACDLDDTGTIDFDDLVEFANGWLN